MFSTRFARDIAASLRLSWRSLVGVDVLYKLLAFVLLTPLFVLLFRCLLTLAGRSVLSDIDIVMFFAGPFGWLCAIALGAVWLAIVALEQASLLAILAARSIGQNISVLAALCSTAGQALNVLRVTVRMIGWCLLTLAPFLLAAIGVYFGLLGEYDINYYLSQRPFEFTVALVVGGVLALLLVGILLRLCSGWFLALPLVLFDQVPPDAALRESQSLVSGHRSRVLIWLVVWACAVIAVNVLLTLLIGGVGRLLIPATVGSLVILAARVGALLILLGLAGLVVNLCAAIGLAGILFHGYQRIHPGAADAIRAAAPARDFPMGSVRLLTRGRLLSAGVIGVLTAAITGYWALNSVQLEDDVQIMAHRGASKAAPENTIAAIRQAIEDGADWVEIDVQETADGAVVVLHDSDFMKLASNPLKIWDANLADLDSIDIGSWFDAKFAGERVPTLTEVLQLCKDKVGVNIELKYYGHDQQLEQRVVDIVESLGMAQQVMVMSLKPEGVAKIRALRPDWTCGLLLSVHAGNLRNVNADFLAVNAGFATRNFVKRAGKAGKKVFVWTVNDAATMSTMLNRNVDGILTDRPDLARRVLADRAQMSTSERLLAEISVFFNQPPANPEQ